jgi:hypothetical protein
MPAVRKISHTVDGATATPIFASSPCIRRYPHSGFSFARRTARRAMLRAVGDGRACAACWCHTSSRPACGARPAAWRALLGRSLSRAFGGGTVPARRTRPGRPARTVSVRRGGAAPRSRAGGPATRQPSPGRCGTPGRPRRVLGTSAG